MKLSEFVKNIRKNKGFTQIVFAKRLKMTQPTISGWENGTRALSERSSRKLVKFCRDNVIEINLEELY